MAETSYFGDVVMDNGKSIHLMTPEEVFQEEYKKDPRTNVRLRIGVFAGGGAKGLMGLRMAQAIENKMADENKKRAAAGSKMIKGQFIDSVDVLSGTSTGGIMACLLALRKSNDPNSPDYVRAKYTVEDIIKIYRKELPNIFKENLLQQGLRMMRGKGRFSRKGLVKLAGEIFGDIEFNTQNFLVPITIPIVDDRTGESVIFRSEDNLKNKVTDVLLATSAAVPYFSPYEADFEIKRRGFKIRQKIIAKGNNSADVLYKDDGNGKRRVVAIDGAFHDNAPDLDVVSHYWLADHPVLKKLGRNHINRGVETSVTVIEFGTGEDKHLGKKYRKNIYSVLGRAADYFIKNKGRELLQKVFRLSNLRNNKLNGKAKQYNHHHITFDVDVKEKISLTAASKKSINAIEREAKRAIEFCEDGIDQYVKFDFCEYLYRKCDRKMQEYVKTDEYKAWLAKQKADVRELEEENKQLDSITQIGDCEDITQRHIKKELALVHGDLINARDRNSLSRASLLCSVEKRDYSDYTPAQRNLVLKHLAKMKDERPSFYSGDDDVKDYQHRVNEAMIKMGAPAASM